MVGVIAAIEVEGAAGVLATGIAEVVGVVVVGVLATAPVAGAVTAGTVAAGLNGGAVESAVLATAVFGAVEVAGGMVAFGLAANCAAASTSVAFAASDGGSGALRAKKDDSPDFDMGFHHAQREPEALLQPDVVTAPSSVAAISSEWNMVCFIAGSFRAAHRPRVLRE